MLRPRGEGGWWRSSNQKPGSDCDVGVKYQAGHEAFCPAWPCPDPSQYPVRWAEGPHSLMILKLKLKSEDNRFVCLSQAWKPGLEDSRRAPRPQPPSVPPPSQEEPQGARCQ